MKRLMFVLALLFWLIIASMFANAMDIPLEVKETLGIARSGEMIHNGIPIARVENIRTITNLKIEDNEGNGVPATFEVLGRWAGNKDDTTKNIQWLLVSFPCDITANGSKMFYLRTGTPAAHATTVDVTENSGKLTVDTGVAEFVIDTLHMTLFDSISRNGTEILAGTVAAGGSTSTISGQNTAYANPPSVVKIERENPLYVCIKLEGDYTNTPVGGATIHTKPLSYKIRYEFFAGSPTAIVYHKFYWPGQGTDSTWNLYDDPILVDNVTLDLPGMAGFTAADSYADASTYYSGALTGGQTAGVAQKLRDPFANPHVATVIHGTRSKSTQFASQPMLINRSANGSIAVSIDHMKYFEPQSIHTDNSGKMTVNVMAEHQYFASFQGTWARVGVSALPAGADYQETVEENFAPLNNRLFAFPTSVYSAACGVFREIPGTPGPNSSTVAQNYYTRLKEVTAITKDFFVDEKFHGLMTWGALVRYADPSYVETGTGTAWDKLYQGGKMSDYHNAWNNVVFQFVLEKEPDNLYDLSFMGARRMLHTQIIQPDAEGSNSRMGWGFSGYGRYRYDGNSCHSYFDNLYSYYYMTGDMEVIDVLTVGGRTKQGWYTRDANGALNDPTGGSTSGWNTFVSRTACQTATTFNFLGHTHDAAFLDDFFHIFSHALSSHIALLQNGDGKEYGFLCQAEIATGFKTEQSWMQALYFMDTLHRLHNEWGDLAIGVDDITVSRVFRAIGNSYMGYISRVLGDGTWGSDWTNLQTVNYSGYKIGGTIDSVQHLVTSSDPIVWTGSKAAMLPLILRAGRMNNDMELMNYGQEGLTWLDGVRLQTAGNSPWNKVTALLYARLHYAIAYSSAPSVNRSMRLTAPNGGEALVVGNYKTITWATTPGVGGIIIEYSTDNGSNWTSITAATPNDGSYEWKVPDAVSTSCLVRISDAGGTLFDYGDQTFSIRRHTSIGGQRYYIMHGNDYNGDNIADIAVYRPSNGRWCIKGQPSIAWGAPGDIPVPGDYNGDGTTDLAVFRPSNGRWCIKGQASIAWGAPGDIPVPGDYNGDGTTDLAIFRPSNGRWCIMGQPSIGWGAAGDMPLPGDYNGDGSTDIAVYRPSNGRWCIMGQPSQAYGAAGDIPVPGDYDGNGTTDIAVFRPVTGRWCVKGLPSVAWGAPTDIPIPGDFDGDGDDDFTIYRPSNGTWAVKGIPSVRYGAVGDIPLITHEER
ncbi:MAG: hypothetical protein GY765_01915 [bacterium]|nr:hypothetical protein [bacterium]